MRNFWTYGIIICILFAAAGGRGYAVSSLFLGTKWSPQGRAIHK
jgi:hypothetical protein